MKKNKSEVKCKACSSESEFLFSNLILGKYTGHYWQCNTCGFIQVNEPHWLDEAYAKSITKSDVGYVLRNQNDVRRTKLLLKLFYQRSQVFLDYGGGYGLFTRIMRDNGYDFYLYDKYTENIFAENFECDFNTSVCKKFAMITAFEVLEHTEEPYQVIKDIMSRTDSLLLSTLLYTQNNKDLKMWWYFAPEEGQHISFFTKESLKIIAQSLQLQLYTNNRDLHLLTRKRFVINPVLITSIVRDVVNKLFGRYFFSKKSLLSQDSKELKEALNKG